MKYYLKFEIRIIGLIFIICASNINWGKDRWKDIIATDGKGYYAYLPAIFIYHDSSFSFHNQIEEKYYPPYSRYDYRIKSGDQTLNKYFVGTAIAELPFFVIAHFTAKIFHYPADGYSFPYQVAINIAAIFYTLAGFWFMKKWLQQYSFKPVFISITLLCLAFGTHLFYYTVDDASLSHAYSFGITSAFIFLASQFFRNKNEKLILLLSTLLAWIILIRPVNGIIVFALPFLAGNKESFLEAIAAVKRKRVYTIFSFFLLICIPGIQLLAYYWQTGHYFVYTYGSEHLDLLQPHFVDFLFSYKKGLFIYTPLLLLSLFGFLHFAKTNKWQLFTLSGFLIILIYILSCWSVWWYGGSFSQRPVIEFLPFFALPFCHFLQLFKKRILSIITGTLIIFFITMNQVQIYQYRYNVIHWENMDKEHYWRVFLRIDQIMKNENANKDLLPNH